MSAPRRLGFCLSEQNAPSEKEELNRSVRVACALPGGPCRAAAADASNPRGGQPRVRARAGETPTAHRPVRISNQMCARAGRGAPESAAAQQVSVREGGWGWGTKK